MLASEVSSTRTKKLMGHADWCMQQKLDGQRVLIRVEDRQVTALNRHGDPKVTMVTNALLASFQRFGPGVWCFDGELMPDGVLWLFDLLVPGIIDEATPHHARRRVLEGLCAQWDMPACVQLLFTARTPLEKQRLFAAVEAADGEGWVIKHHAHPYLSGQRSPQVLKYKRWHEVDAVIRRININGKENAELELYDATGTTVPIGMCSLLGKPDVHIGDVVSVQYLYSGANHRLVQPSLLRIRDDKRPDECLVNQLRPVNKEVVSLS